jgi:hypothetical protein
LNTQVLSRQHTCFNGDAGTFGRFAEIATSGERGARRVVGIELRQPFLRRLERVSCLLLRVGARLVATSGVAVVIVVGGNGVVVVIGSTCRTRIAIRCLVVIIAVVSNTAGERAQEIAEHLDGRRTHAPLVIEQTCLERGQ